MMESQVTQEQLECIVDRTIQEADLDNDDAISFEEFRKVKFCITLFSVFMVNVKSLKHRLLFMHYN